MSLYLLHVKHMMKENKSEHHFALSEYTKNALHNMWSDVDIAQMLDIDKFDLELDDELEITQLNILELPVIKAED